MTRRRKLTWYLVSSVTGEPRYLSEKAEAERREEAEKRPTLQQKESFISTNEY